MSAPIDLRGTYGWHLSAHARRQASTRGVGVRQVLEAVADPSISYTAFHEGPGRYVYKRGEVAVVGVPATRTVVTVLWNTAVEWTSEEFSAHMRTREREVLPRARG